MSRVKSKDTSPEMRVRRAAHALGLRFRLHRRDLPGKPDLVFPKHRTALFVHGCFWHRHPGCPKASVPKTRTAYWMSKFDANVTRDIRVWKHLERLGWRVAVIWGCMTSDRKALDDILAQTFGSGSKEGIAIRSSKRHPRESDPLSEIGH